MFFKPNCKHVRAWRLSVVNINRFEYEKIIITQETLYYLFEFILFI